MSSNSIMGRLAALERQHGDIGVTVDADALSPETQAQLHYVDGKLDVSRLSQDARREILRAADKRRGMA